MLPSLCLLSSTGPRDSNHGTSRRTYAPGGGECALPAAPSLSPPSAAGGCLSLFFALLAVSYESRTPPSLWSPSHTRHQPRPRSHAARLGFRCHRSARRLSRRHPPPRLKKIPYYRTVARARSRSRGNVRWELDFCIDFTYDGTSPRPRVKSSPRAEFGLTSLR